MKIDSPAKIFIIGIAFAIIITASGLFYINKLNSNLRQLETECSAQDDHAASKWEGKDIKWETVCDAETLKAINSNTGIQARIVTLYNEIQTIKQWPITVSATILLFSFIPWAWYFILKRIKELREAILGK